MGATTRIMLYISLFLLGFIGILSTGGLPKKGKGNLGQQCREDGTCNSPNLVCLSTLEESYLCGLVVPKIDRSCTSEPDCFCETCLKRCGTSGIKRCEFTDTTVWGSKPTVCECRP
jgi:hypothetical protein